jgi:hypothetical protein
MPEEKPFVGEYPNIVERNLSSKPEEREREFNYYRKLLELSTELKANEHLLIEFEIGTAQVVLGNFRAVFSDLVPTKGLEKAIQDYWGWFKNRFNNLKDQRLYIDLYIKGLKLLETAYNSFENKRQEEDLQQKLQGVLKSNEKEKL